MYKIVAAAGVGVAAVPLAIILLVAASLPTSSQAGGDAALAGAPTALAMQDIPANYLAWYMAAAQTCPGLPWSVLAGIGKVESNHGRSTLPGVHSGANSAGAEGPMQFLPGTFAEYAVNADPGSLLTPYNPADSIYTAARMLCADGARGGTNASIQQAIFDYNHADWYVTDVLAWAVRYAAPAGNAAVAAAIVFAQAQVGKPYCWGGQGPACFDCSGLVFAAYAAAGIHIARTTYQWQQDGPEIPLSQIQPGDLLFSAGSDGTPASPGHVVMYLGSGQVIQAPETGQDVQVDLLDLAAIVVATRPAELGISP
jgi:cell wall-associated NlpC family hydrolase